MVVRKCTLCLIPCIPEEINKIDKNLVSSQMSVFYLVHTMLDIPLDECTKYLEKYGNPADWVTLCPKCSVTLEEAQDLGRQLGQLKNRLDDLKELMTIQIRLKFEKEEDFNEDEESKIQTAAYVIRQYVNYGSKDVLDLLKPFEEEDNYSENMDFEEVKIDNLPQPSSSIKDPISIQVDYDEEVVSRFKCEDTEKLHGYFGDELEVTEHQNMSDNVSDDACDSPDYSPEPEPVSNQSLKIVSDHIRVRKSNPLRKTVNGIAPAPVTSNSLPNALDVVKAAVTKLNAAAVTATLNLTLAPSAPAIDATATGCKCIVCGKFFDTLSALENHIRAEHHPPLVSTCLGCFTNIPDSGKFHLHSSKNLECWRKSIRCLKCRNVQFATKQSLHIHNFVRHGRPIPILNNGQLVNDPEFVEEPSSSFPTLTMPVTTVENPTTILTATATSPRFHESTPTYNQKLRVLMGSQPTDAGSDFVSCNICQESFPNAKDVSEHKYSVHKYGVKCPDPTCLKVLASPYSLEEHIRGFHRSESIKVCSGCNKIMPDVRTNTFFDHLIDSPLCKTKAVVCAFCKNYDYRFLNQEALNVHLEVSHTVPVTTVTAFPCLSCDKKFDDQYSLKSHETNLHAPKKFICEKCGKGFLTDRFLKKHVTTVHLNREEDLLKPFEEEDNYSKNMDFEEVKIDNLVQPSSSIQDPLSIQVDYDEKLVSRFKCEDTEELNGCFGDELQVTEDQNMADNVIEPADACYPDYSPEPEPVSKQSLKIVSDRIRVGKSNPLRKTVNGIAPATATSTSLSDPPDIVKAAVTKLNTPAVTAYLTLAPSAPAIDATTTGYKCIVCDKLFGTLFILENHIRAEHHLPLVSTCLGCFTNIPDSGKFHLHLSENPECLRNVLRCLKCRNVQFATKQSLRIHNFVRHGKPIPKLENGHLVSAPEFVEPPSTFPTLTMPVTKILTATGTSSRFHESIPNYNQKLMPFEDNYSENMDFEEVKLDNLAQPASSIKDPISIQVDYDEEVVSRFKCEDTEHQIFRDGDEVECLTPPPGHHIISCGSGGDNLYDQNLSENVNEAWQNDAHVSDYRSEVSEPELIVLDSSHVGSNRLGITKSVCLRRSKNYPSNPNISKEKKKSNYVSTKSLNNFNSTSQIRNGNRTEGSNFSKQSTHVPNILQRGRQIPKLQKRQPITDPEFMKRSITSVLMSKSSMLTREEHKLPISVITATKSESTPVILSESESDFVSCNICHESFPNAKSVSEHKYTVHKYGVKCSYPSCLQILSSPWSVEEHIRAIHRPKSIRFCSGCNKTMPNPDSHTFLDHIEVNPLCKSKALSCPFCKIQYRFPTQEALDVHLEIRHTNTSLDVYPCRSCDKKFSDQHSLTTHERKHHYVPPKNCICLKCGAEFLSAAHVTRHFSKAHLNI